MIGDDGAGNQIGMAPGAKWIGCRNMDVGNGTPATYSECFEFFIAPTDSTGANPDPSKALSDGPNAYRLGQLKKLLTRLLRVHRAANE